MKNIENFGVQELNALEVENIDGGIFGLDDLLIGIAVGVAVEVLGDWDHFKDGLGL